MQNTTPIAYDREIDATPVVPNLTAINVPSTNCMQPWIALRIMFVVT